MGIPISFFSIKNQKQIIIKMVVMKNSLLNFYIHTFLVDLSRSRRSPYSNRSSPSSAKPSKPKVIIADFTEQSFQGICLCFIRNSNQMMITEQNIADVIFPNCSSLSHFLFLRKFFFIQLNV